LPSITRAWFVQQRKRRLPVRESGNSIAYILEVLNGETDYL